MSAVDCSRIADVVRCGLKRTPLRPCCRCDRRRNADDPSAASQRIPVTDRHARRLARTAARQRRAPAAGAGRPRSRRSSRACSRRIHAHDVDFADLYFQHSRFESWSLEEGIVKAGTFSIDRGVGVRAVSGDKQAFAYSDDISLAALEEAATAVRAIGRQGQSASTPLAERGRTRLLYPTADPVMSLGDAEKVARADAARTPRARARSARRAGDGIARRRARDGADRAQRRHARGRRAAAGADVDHRDRRGERPARAGPRRRRRAARLRVLHRRAARRRSRGRRSTRR